MRDVRSGFKFGDTARDLVHAGQAATDVDGRVDSSSGPRLLGTAGTSASFSNAGRLVTPLNSGLDDSHAFSIEMWFRADGCTNSWGRAAGTETADRLGREGLSIFFYPKRAEQACRLGVEVWHRDRYQLGCPGGMRAPEGQWVHLAITYSDKTLACYLNGRLTEKHRNRHAAFGQHAAFDIGSAGAGVAGSLSSGSLAEVAVYNKALPQSILSRHAAALSKAP